MNSQVERESGNKRPLLAFFLCYLKKLISVLIYGGHSTGLMSKITVSRHTLQ